MFCHWLSVPPMEVYALARKAVTDRRAITSVKYSVSYAGIQLPVWLASSSPTDRASETSSSDSPRSQENQVLWIVCFIKSNPTWKISDQSLWEKTWWRFSTHCGRKRKAWGKVVLATLYDSYLKIKSLSKANLKWMTEIEKKKSRHS